MTLLHLLSLWIVLYQATAITDDANCTGHLECLETSLACPSDSSVQDGTCSCDSSLCKAPPTCYNHQQLALVKTATKVPGYCCDMYECLNKPDTNCSEVVCPKEETECPADSYRLPNTWHPGGCCGKSHGCQCLPSSCLEPTCSEQEVARVVRVGTGNPGSCCPIYECIAKDVNEACENGTSWLSADCEECKCERGIKFCAKVECPKLPDPCTRTGRGRCCPVCLEELVASDVEPTSSGGLIDSNSEISSCLLENGTLVHVGDTYFADPCTNCTCQRGGRKHCTASMCEVSCVDPKYVPGECCPVCDGSDPLLVPYPYCKPLVNCKLRCKRGFFTTPDGCIACQCQDEECILDCQHGYLKDTNGNDLCECAPPPEPQLPSPPDCPPLMDCNKKCPHGLKRKQGCEICKCASCPSMNLCEKQCSNGYAKDENNCHMCKCKASGDNSNSACYTEGGIWRDDSEVWRDGCHECHCIEGREMCTLIACPALSCSHPTPANSTQCCPYCPDGPTTAHQAAVCMDFHGQLKLEGQHWTLNSCTDCTCKEGKVLCYSQQCPPVACPHPVEEDGGCCPRCVEDEGVTALVISDENGEEDCGNRKNGSAWREGPCVSCRCERGHRICYQQECPSSSVPCVRAVTPKHACCATCLDALLPKSNETPGSQGCRHGNVTYLHNQEWRLDDCTRCACQDGNQHCTQQVCSLGCSKPVAIAGQCCPLCLEPPPSTDTIDPSTKSQIQESLYILLVILFCISVLFSLYACRQMRVRRQRMRLQDYGCAPPQYQYKYIPTYNEDPHGRPTLPPSSEEKEKLALAPV